MCKCVRLCACVSVFVLFLALMSCEFECDCERVLVSSLPKCVRCVRVYICRFLFTFHALMNTRKQSNCCHEILIDFFYLVWILHIVDDHLFFFCFFILLRHKSFPLSLSLVLPVLASHTFVHAFLHFLAYFSGVSHLNTNGPKYLFVSLTSCALFSSCSVCYFTNAVALLLLVFSFTIRLMKYLFSVQANWKRMGSKRKGKKTFFYKFDECKVMAMCFNRWVYILLTCEWIGIKWYAWNFRSLCIGWKVNIE